MPNSGAAWKEQKVTAGDGGPEDWFGTNAAISGDIALIAAKNAIVDGKRGQGAVYVFMRSNGVWKQTQKIVAKDGGPSDQFGNSIRLAGSTAFIAAPIATIDGILWQGAVYVFTLSRNRWIQRQKIVLSEPRAFDTFGISVTLTENQALIGSGGARNTAQQTVPRKVHVFKRVRSSQFKDIWIETQVLENPNPEDENNMFGASLIMSETFALVGARAASINNNVGQGAVYVYSKSGDSWSLSKMLTANDGAANDGFGVSLALYDNAALVGASGVQITGPSEGAVYEFGYSGGIWKQTQKFIPSDSAPLSLFGASLSLWENRQLLVGSYAADAHRGSAYVFRNQRGHWTQVKKLTASDRAPGDVFGYYTALAADTALVGAYTAQIGGNSKQGAAYFYTAPSRTMEN